MGRSEPVSNYRPSAPEVRAALERIVASPVFSKSPQLASFLRYVVEATLRGEAARLKAYTIATVALGRSESFDPQKDPIVRVEAGRLRRALRQYYLGVGASDLVIIDLARGSYAPDFRRRVNWPSRLQAWLPQAFHPKKLSWRAVAVGAMAVAFISGTLNIVQAVLPDSQSDSPPLRANTARIVSTSPFPVVSVDPFDKFADSPEGAVNLSRLSKGLRDALGRFDEIEVLWPRSTTTDPPIDFRISATPTAEANGITLTIRLIDGVDGLQLWSRTFDLTRSNEQEIIRTVSATLAQPYGVIHAHMRAVRSHGRRTYDPRYSCILDGLDALPKYEVATDATARACLEREVRADPTFSYGFALLSALYCRQHIFGFDSPENESLTDKALAAAQRALMLKPESARMRHTMMNVRFCRGELDAAIVEGEQAMEINPNDTVTAGAFGIRLALMGDVDRAMPLMLAYHRFNGANSSRLNFALFFVNHLQGKPQTAAFHANQIVASQYSLGYLARALVAANAGHRVAAQEELTRLRALHPRWQNPYREIRLLFPKTEIAARIIHELIEAGAIGPEI